MKRIDIIPIKLENQEPFGDDAAMWVELHDKYIKMRHKFMAREPIDIDDKAMGWEDVRNDYEMIARKEFIAGIEKQWLSKSKKWAIYIMIEGISPDMKWYYKTETKATEAYDIVQGWLLGTLIV